MNPTIALVILLFVCILMPLAFAWRIWRLDEATRAGWLANVADAAVFVLLIMLVGRWDIAGAYTRLVLAALVALAETGDVTGPTAKGLLPEVLAGADPTDLIAARGLRAVADQDALGALVDATLAAHPDVAAGARANPKAVNFLMGQVMRASGGQARPDAVRALLRTRLSLEEP